MKREGSCQGSMNKSAGKEGGTTSGWWVRGIKEENGYNMTGRGCFAQIANSMQLEMPKYYPWHTKVQAREHKRA